MTDENTETHNEDDDGEESPVDLKQRAKAYLIAACAYVAGAIAKSVEEIAPQLRSVSLPGVSSRAAKSLLLAGVLITAAVAMPADPFGGGESSIETQDPVQGETYEATDRAPTFDGATMNKLPSTFTDAAADAPAPPDQVRASAGSQTMNVQTSVRNGEPAIVLEDDRTHDGRWVSLETTWFEENLGEVPNAAFITHESGDEYAAPLQVRGDSAAFYVREFSTNTVTFDGQVTLSGAQAGDGTQYEYELNDTSGVDDPSINLTGVENTAPASAKGTYSDGDTDSFIVGGTDPPRDETVTLSATTSESVVTKNSTISSTTAIPLDHGIFPSKSANASVSSTKEVIDAPASSSTVNTSSVDYVTAFAESGVWMENGWDISIDGQQVAYDWNGGKVTFAPIAVDNQTSISWDRNNDFSNREVESGDQIHLWGGTPDVNISDSSGGTTITGSGTKSLDLSGNPSNITVTPSSGTAEINVSYTKVDGVKDVSVDVGSSSVSHSGELDGSVTKSVDLSEGTNTINPSYTGTSDGLTIEPSWTEVSETTDPVVEVNGHETSYTGTLSDGETTSLATNQAWLENGTNTVVINTSTPSTGPESLVGFEYAHDASGTTQSVDVEATSWTEAFNVSNTFPSAVTGADATLTFNEDVAEIDGVEYRTNGGEWTSPPGYELNGTDLEVDLGDISADTTVDVRATGYKINTYDGEIDILSPTVEGDELATEVEVTSLLEGGMFGIRVDGTAVGDRIHYASDYSWSGEPAHVDVTSSGTQILRSPDVNVGSTMTVSSSPISVTPESGAVEVVVEDGEEPRFKIRQGDTVGASSVDVTYHDTLDGERYVLYSETENRQIDAARANSPVTFTTDGDTETYTVRQVDREGAVGGGAPPERNGGSTAPLVLVVPAVGLSVAGLFFAGRRFGGATGLRGNAVLIGASTVVSVTALELVTPGSLISQVYRATVFALGDAAASGLGAVLAAIATIVGLWQLQQRTRADVPIWVTIPSVSLAAVLALESIRPGSVLGALEGVIAEVGALLALLAVAGIFYWWRNRNQVEKAEASTPDTQVTLDLGDQGGDD